MSQQTTKQSSLARWKLRWHWSLERRRRCHRPTTREHDQIKLLQSQETIYTINTKCWLLLPFFACFCSCSSTRGDHFWQPDCYSRPNCQPCVYCHWRWSHHHILVRQEWLSNLRWWSLPLQQSSHTAFDNVIQLHSRSRCDLLRGIQYGHRWPGPARESAGNLHQCSR